MKRMICVIGLLAAILPALFAQNAESQMVRTRKYQIITHDDIDKLLANQQIQVSSISSAENLKKMNERVGN